MAVEVELDVDGIEEFQRKMDFLDSAMQRHVYSALHSIGSDIKADAQRFAPVRTHRLRLSIYSRVVDWLLEVGATAPYAWFQEFGTRFIQAKRFLWRAIQRNLPNLRRTMDYAVDHAIREAAAS